MAIIVSHNQGKQIILFSDEYTRPITSKVYANVQHLVLHPILPLYAASINRDGVSDVLMTGVEYSGGQQSQGMPFFTHDGKDLVFFGCDIDCFVSINGRKTPLNGDVNATAHYALKPSAGNFAMASSTSLIVRRVEKNELWVSTMCDETTHPRYNWRNGFYEALGKINERLYLLRCQP
jgi:hypothetical protein